MRHPLEYPGESSPFTRAEWGRIALWAVGLVAAYCLIRWPTAVVSLGFVGFFVLVALGGRSTS